MDHSGYGYISAGLSHRGRKHHSRVLAVADHSWLRRGMFAVADTPGIVLKAALERSRTAVAVLRNIAVDYCCPRKALEAVVKQKLAARHIVVAMSPAGDKAAVGTRTGLSDCPDCPHNPSAGYDPCWHALSKLVIQLVTVLNIGDSSRQSCVRLRRPTRQLKKWLCFLPRTVRLVHLMGVYCTSRACILWVRTSRLASHACLMARVP